MPTTTPAATPLLLIVRDGWGENPNPEHDAFNAVKLARTPVADAFASRWPRTLIRTSGEDVGLPAGTMGNSEVGHQNIGAGRIVAQALMRITGAIHDGSFARNAGLLAAFEHAERTGGCVHLLGLASDGQVHSDLDHVDALVDMAAARGLPAARLVVHVFTDGRDTGPFTGAGFVERIEAKMAAAGIGRIGSVIGRFYAMDRDHRWERVAAAYAALTGLGPDDATRVAASAGEAVQSYYDHPTDANRPGDEFVMPTRIVPAGRTPALVSAGDAVIFFNFRGDRPREITRAFVLDDAAWADVQGGGFDRGPRLDDLHFCTLTSYEAGLPVHVAFERPPKIPDILGAVVADAGLTQFRCAETEKFPHVTFFFNDYREDPFDGESRLLVPSPRDVSTYDQKPEMSAAGVCAGVLERLAADDREPLLVVNFANPDMVGHTGNLDAVVRAVETVDACVGQLTDAVLARGGSAIVTADHGNAEQMWNPATDSPHTAHTTYDVPLFVIGAPFAGRALREGGRLGDIAPTALQMMGIDAPDAMTGQSLLS